MGDVFIVSGERGEYSGHREWMVAWYADEATAREHADRAKAWNEAFKVPGFDPWDDEWQAAYRAAPNPYDPTQGQPNADEWWSGDLAERYNVTKVPAGILPEIQRRMP